MYATNQVQPLFELIDALLQSASSEGCSDDLTVVSFEALEKVSEKLQALKSNPQNLDIGVHEHRHGESVYVFLTPEAKPMTQDDFAAYLGSEYEPDRAESLLIYNGESPEVVI